MVSVVDVLKFLIIFEQVHFHFCTLFRALSDGIVPEEACPFYAMLPSCSGTVDPPLLEVLLQGRTVECLSMDPLRFLVQCQAWTKPPPPLAPLVPFWRHSQR